MLSFAETVVSPRPFGGPEAEGMVSGTVAAVGVAGAQLLSNATVIKSVRKKTNGVLNDGWKAFLFLPFMIDMASPFSARNKRGHNLSVL
jgi:hypothetical protein